MAENFEETPLVLWVQPDLTIVAGGSSAAAKGLFGHSVDGLCLERLVDGNFEAFAKLCSEVLRTGTPLMSTDVALQQPDPRKLLRRDLCLCPFPRGPDTSQCYLLITVGGARPSDLDMIPPPGASRLSNASAQPLAQEEDEVEDGQSPRSEPEGSFGPRAHKGAENSEPPTATPKTDSIPFDNLLPSPLREGGSETPVSSVRQAPLLHSQALAPVPGGSQEIPASGPPLCSGSQATLSPARAPARKSLLASLQDPASADSAQFSIILDEAPPSDSERQSGPSLSSPSIVQESMNDSLRYSSMRSSQEESVGDRSSSLRLTHFLSHETEESKPKKEFAETHAQTEISWEKHGFVCVRCAKPPLMPMPCSDSARAMAVASRLNRRKKNLADDVWTLLRDQEEHEMPEGMLRLHITGNRFTDNLGNVGVVEKRGKEVFIEGCKIELEGAYTLHIINGLNEKLTYTRGDGGRGLGVPLKKRSPSKHSTPGVSTNAPPQNVPEEQADDEEEDEEKEEWLASFDLPQVGVPDAAGRSSSMVLPNIPNMADEEWADDG